MSNRLGVLTFVLIFLFQGFSSVLNAQKSGFSGKADTYFDELREYCNGDVNMKKEALEKFDALLNTYSSLWLSMSEQQKKDVANLSIQMNKKRIRPLPGFYEFIEAQMAFMNNKNQSSESFTQWIKGLMWIINNSTIKGFNDAVESSLFFARDNYLYSSRAVNWIAKHDGFIIRLDNERGPYFEFTSSLDLTYSSQKEDNTIYQTKGRFFIAEQLFEGFGGKVDWSRTGLSKEEVFVELSKYTVSLKRSAIFADSVYFTNKEYFQHKLRGSFEDICGDKVGNTNFPKFFSYKREEIIKNIFTDVDYVGGFTQQGGKVLGTGDALEPAELVFKRGGKVFCKAKAIVHPFSRDGITTPDCQVTFYVDNDSIYHPGLVMKYNKGNREIVCTNNKEGISASPWVDSYHAIDIYTEALYAKLDDAKIEFTSIKGPSSASFATFESNNYYSEGRWYKLQGIDEVNPLYRIKSFTDKYNKTTFTVKEFARFLGLDETQSKVTLMRLAISGFIVYESYRETAIVKQKLYDYIKAFNKKQDYDNIRMTSATKNGEPNAVYDLSSKDLIMSGIERFSISDTHFVNIMPVQGKIKMKKNRSFEFDGRVYAGRFDMGGEKCYFDYDNFLLKLPKIDSLAFYVPLFEDTTKLYKIQTPLQDLICELVVDAPNNKSGIKKLSGYPMLKSLEESYVYYNNPKIQNGVYDKSKFYFRVEPFEFKNLFGFRTDSVSFNGVLTSGGIFPDIKEPLRVMRDYSLGLVVQTPATGFPAYGGKGQYYKQIDLSLQGLLGAGYLDYVASRTDSRMFVFHIDSMFTTTDKFTCLEKGSGIGGSVEFPQVSVTKTSEHWYPYQDYMFVEQKAEPFYMYNGEALHSGSLTVRPQGLSGRGSTQSKEMIVQSSLTNFKSLTYKSDTSNFVLKSLSGEDVAFKANNLKANVDFVSRKGEFVSNEGVKPCELTYLQYVCEVDKFEWGLDIKELALSNSNFKDAGDYPNKELKDLVDIEQPGAKFTSTHPKQYDLNFNAVKANLNLKSNKLVAEDVFVLKSADAAIRPTDAQLTIRPGAQIDTIDDAKILVDLQTRLHEFYNARVHIVSSKLYSANGYANFVSEDNKTQPIFFSKIYPDPSSTKAYGKVLDTMPIMLSSAFRFKGDVSFDAKDTNYTFDGGLQLSYDCSDDKSWLKFKATINPMDIYIPISEAPTSTDNRRLTASILFNPKNLQPKVAFLTTDKDADNAFMSAKGFLTFDKNSNEYRIASREKLEDMQDVIGDYLTINQKSCQAKAEGVINLGLSQNAITMFNYGVVKANNSKQEAELDISLGLKFPFSQKALDYMGVELYEDMNLSVLELEESGYNKQLVALAGDNKGNALYEDLLITGEWKEIPKEMDYTLYFTNVRMKWEPSQNAYISNSEAELALVGKYQVNKKIRAKIELVKSSLSTEIKIYLEANPDHWYFFTYNGAAMSAMSSYEIFNDYIKEVPNKEREFKGKDGKIFTYRIATPNEKRNFIKKLELNNQEEE